MGNTSDYGFRNWGMLLQKSSFPLLNVYEEQSTFKAQEILFYFVKFHVYGIVYKNAQKEAFSYPCYIREVCALLLAFSNTAVE